MRFSDKLQIGEIKVKEPQDNQEWIRVVLRIILKSGNGSRTPTGVKEKDLPRSTAKNKEENM